MSKSKTNKKQRARQKRPRSPIIMIGVIVAVVVISVAVTFFLIQRNAGGGPTSTADKPVILYVNQGNALVSVNNFTALTSFASSNGFNMIFFQVYRSGNLLFPMSNLSYFVRSAHGQSLKIFFSLYFTGPNQQIPGTLYNLGEDGISLDMSTLASSDQTSLLSTLQRNYKNGETAVTTTNFGTGLRPDLLILETYGPNDQSFIHHGIIASVEPLILSSKQQYTSQFQYAMQNSDGVMVFDYYGLLKTGY